jgi:NDP-sugar pyrophosphorylase family protein
MQAVILAGGKGTRLKPFTNAIPKPLVPIGDKPILEIILKQLKFYGVTDIVIAVNHLARLIMAFFGDGESLGLKIRYSLEEKVLGTAAPLKLIEGLHDKFLVMNGDLLTTLNFGDLYKFHQTTGAEATICIYKKDVKIDLGVIHVDGDTFINYEEKPTLHYMVSMGIYALSKSVLEVIPEDTKFDMPDLIHSLHAGGKAIKCYTGNYEWLDIGRLEDYEAAVEIFENSRSLYLPA